MNYRVGEVILKLIEFCKGLLRIFLMLWGRIEVRVFQAAKPRKLTKMKMHRKLEIQVIHY